MRACARVALASIAVSSSFSLSGCAAIEELKETFLRWVESQKLPSGRGVSADELPEATPVVPPEKTPKEQSKRHPRPKDAARKLQRQTVVLPPKKPPIPDFVADDDVGDSSTNSFAFRSLLVRCPRCSGREAYWIRCPRCSGRPSA
jgi:hypothetical protein